MVFLSETKLFGQRAANLRKRLGFDGMFYVNCEGRSGGLALLWRDAWQVHFRSSACSHIDVDVISDSEVPWICGGDFNEILNPSEVAGGSERSLNEMWLFMEALDWCDLTDMGFVGLKLTIFEDSWKTLHFDGSPSRLVSGLTACVGSLRKWGSRIFGNSPRKVARLQNLVEALHKGPRDSDSLVKIREAEKEFDKPVDQELISSIPLGNAIGGDKWAWHFNSKGLYKVRSGYRAIMESKHSESSSTDSSDVLWWRKLWSLPIPPKGHLFVWRAFHEILLTMVSLRHRGIDCDVACPRCKDVMKSSSHAIFDCPISQMVWKMSRFWKVIENRRAMPFADFLRIMSSEVSMEDLALVCWLAWKLWCERNKVVHGGEVRDPQAIFDLSIASFGEWQALNKVSIQSQAVGSDVWSPPQPGYLKLNIDASVFPNSDRIGIGAAIHDDKGSILGAVAKSVEGSFSPFVVECLALREGLRFAKEIKCVNIEVETDAINVVSAVVDNRELSMKGQFWRMLNSCLLNCGVQIFIISVEALIKLLIF
ncbi:hypothetical protein TIFTF001_032293 [Ficus carica]|uniref:Reverse transcriptase zinc-binding domain-containing protein n=1 Tax=Ficus carica TaxID=3494 RepID=A0AA88E057_FICCA|nr:hypothetical protein TIFTF001_032293 [Ficus carica]